jgi:hypothetical protein
MITAKQVREWITANPFKLFRVHLSDGSHYDAANRAAIVERNTIDIGVNLDRDGIAEGLVEYSVLHIVKLARLEANLHH